MNYFNKYLKYKNKYLNLKEQLGGSECRSRHKNVAILIGIHNPGRPQRFLFVQETRTGNPIGLPGGKVDKGNVRCFNDALEREYKEEVNKEGLPKLRYNGKDNSVGEFDHNDTIIYLASTKDRIEFNPGQVPPETLKILFVSREKLENAIRNSPSIVNVNGNDYRIRQCNVNSFRELFSPANKHKIDKMFI